MIRDTPLKDGYDRAYIEDVGAALERSWPEFDSIRFSMQVLGSGWDALELKGRMLRIAAVLDELLPGDLERALEVLDPVAARFGGMLGMFFPAFVELRFARDGEANWQSCAAAMVRFTPFSSSEFAVRTMILADQRRMLTEMHGWTEHEDHHVRRLASEGCRPRLPWAMTLPRLKADPSPLLPILEALRGDESEYVRRSVANNLNDISKDHPEWVLEVARLWLGEAPDDKNRVRLVKHACRTLLKAGEPRALLLFGFRDPGGISVSELQLDRGAVKLGEELEFRFRLEGSPSLGRVRLEYDVHYQKANGLLRPKIFRISEFESEEVSREVIRRHSFRDLSTRRHHAGPHELAIRVNGVEKARVGFSLRR